MSGTETEARVLERGRVAPVLALVLFEVLRDQDLPEEVFADEDLSATLPRRLGLSGVIDGQIRRYGGEVKRRRRLPHGEVVDLLRLVVRRPDSAEVFYEIGRRLGRRQAGRRGVGRVLPAGPSLKLAGRRARSRLAGLLGRKAVHLDAGLFRASGRDLITVRGDPGGDACHLITGFLDELLGHYTGRALRMVHGRCQARGGDRCEWMLAEELPDRDENGGSRARVQGTGSHRLHPNR